MLDVFLAGPDDLHRTVHMHGDLNCARDAVNFEPTTKAAADQVVVDDRPCPTAVRWSSRRLACARAMTWLPTQTSQPSLRTWTVQFMGSIAACAETEPGRVASTLVTACVIALVTSPIVLRDRSGIERPLLEITRDILGAERRVRTVVPLNDQGREAFLAAPM